jgi:hypothetical protein
LGHGKKEAPVSEDLLVPDETAWVEESQPRNTKVTGKLWQEDRERRSAHSMLLATGRREGCFQTKPRAFSKPIHMVQGLGASALYELFRVDLRD